VQKIVIPLKQDKFLFHKRELDRPSISIRTMLIASWFDTRLARVGKFERAKPSQARWSGCRFQAAKPYENREDQNIIGHKAVGQYPNFIAMSVTFFSLTLCFRFTTIFSSFVQ
jgi:hypothetical protein